MDGRHGVVDRPFCQKISDAGGGNNHHSHGEEGAKELGDHIVDKISGNRHEDAVFLGGLTQGDTSIVHKHLGGDCQKKQDHKLKSEENKVTYAADGDEVTQTTESPAEGVKERLSRKSDDQSQDHYQGAEGLGNRGNQELDENVLPLGDGESEGQIAFGRIHILIEADNGDDRCQNKQGKVILVNR